MINIPKLILASGSPRRSEILSSVGWEFEKQSADIDETERGFENPSEYVQRLAVEKAAAVASENKNKLVLGADTTVVIDDKIIGKPADLDDGREMLKTLSGRWHEVLTGVALVKDSTVKVGLQTTRVKFNQMSGEEIEYLLQKGEPLDKAGAYAVQAQAALFIEKIEGDYWNVVGLPINLVYRLIKDFD